MTPDQILLKIDRSDLPDSSRFENDFNAYPPERVSLGEYGVVDLAASYQMSRRFELFARVDNLFDKEYQELLDYGTLGAAAYGGIKLSLRPEVLVHWAR